MYSHFDWLSNKLTEYPLGLTGSSWKEITERIENNREKIIETAAVLMSVKRQDNLHTDFGDWVNF